MDRRSFIVNSLGLAGATYLGTVWSSCEPKHQIQGLVTGPNAAAGHKLRDGIITNSVRSVKHDVVIVGGGIAGLSAARHLQRYNVDFVLLELENTPGGNSLSSRNDISHFPLGAHYLPIPSSLDQELLKFLEEEEVITGYQQGKPVYNEFYLCADPKERLFIHEHWQEGLIPHAGVPATDRDEIIRFLALMDHYRHLKGHDGKDAFCIPVEQASHDPQIRVLDTLSFETFLKEKGFRSRYLYWYIDYCCADDFGARAKNTSAWAGIHYFASRKGYAANADHDDVLTWPEGNGWLVNRLRKGLENKIQSNRLVYSVGLTTTGVIIRYLELDTQQTVEVEAHQVIMATPQFVNQRLLHTPQIRPVDYGAFSYAPWMVANATVDGHLDHKRGESLCWDNVIYGSSSLGYVNANHQNVSQPGQQRVITYYAPLLGDDLAAERKKAQASSYHAWFQQMLQDLKRPHPDLEAQIKSFDVWIWGHGMIRPTPGFMFGKDRHQAAESIGGRMHFVHSDTSGISIFEEAFSRGVLGAKKVLAS